MGGKQDRQRVHRVAAFLAAVALDPIHHRGYLVGRQRPVFEWLTAVAAGLAFGGVPPTGDHGVARYGLIVYGHIKNPLQGADNVLDRLRATGLPVY
ncbi:hypothetical protein MINTM008_13610 [Mycobacterium intracellulare]|nr:hypothetical protein MINTM002_11160 [Mycobacterium intracellulare]BCO61274.1 hypothetical protein MINTM006_12240 [Mycobacterium intracellulare]BCO66473.1 hypothetical protein MINTM007_10840 [Mycobacterium intracellulare]BCO72026.1 hypothetical protein MINTM008_13610 [Mycobacterium intracellulare]BCO77472.1 hypothetical protein MINTM009_12540 [Mycobacterium intracellulare]